MTRIYFGIQPVEGVEPGPDAEWADVKESVAPISLDMLRRVGFIAAAFGDRSEAYLQWVADSLSAWHLRDTSGAWLPDAPTVADLGRLDVARIKWLIDVVFRAAVELPNL